MTTKKPARGQEKPRTAERAHLFLRLELDGVAYELDLFDLRARERMELEAHMEKPWARILDEGWVESETFLLYAGYLAMRRKGVSALTFDDFLDQADQHKPKVELRMIRPGEELPERPTATPQTTGSQS